jgi:hypothetical protein
MSAKVTNASLYRLSQNIEMRSTGILGVFGLTLRLRHPRVESVSNRHYVFKAKLTWYTEVVAEFDVFIAEYESDPKEWSDSMSFRVIEDALRLWHKKERDVEFKRQKKVADILKLSQELVLREV